MFSGPAAKSEKRKVWKAGCGGALIVGVLFLACLTVTMSRTVQVRYFFPSATFTDEELGLIKTRVDRHIEANYQRKDGESSGSTWVLELLPERSDKGAEPVYFSDSMNENGYSIGASGGRGFRKWRGELEYLFEIDPYEGYKVERTSKWEKSLQFIRSEF